MHYRCEIVFPAGTEDIKSAVSSVMAKFDESKGEDDDGYSRHAFWDWWVIGGRWAGEKQLAKYDQRKIDQFYEWLTAENVTVSSLRAGKPELSPADQHSKVDAKWSEMFCDGGVMVKCPIFRHSNDSYGDNTALDGDISRLADSLNVKCSRVIFAGPGFRYVEGGKSTHDGPPAAVFMLTTEQWNGCNHMPISWDGTISDAVEQFKKSLERAADEYKARIMPTDDSICVTVDYHS